MNRVRNNPWGIFRIRGVLNIDIRGKSHGLPVSHQSSSYRSGCIVVIRHREKANSLNPAQCNAALKATDHDGFTGKIAFTANGDLKNPSSTLYQVRNNEWVALTTETTD